MKTARIPLLVGEALVFSALVFWWIGGATTAPQVRWQVDQAFASNDPYQAVGAETPIRLELNLPSPAYVYLVSHDLVYGCSAMFPSEYLHSDIPANPIPAGKHLLPGSGTELELSWQSGDATSPFSCMLIVSEQEVPGLRAALGRFRQMGNAAFPRKSLLGGYAPKAGMEQVPAANELLHDAIKASYRLVDANNDGPMIPWKGHPGVFLKVLRLQNNGRILEPGADLREQINANLSQKLEGIVKPSKPGK